MAIITTCPSCSGPLRVPDELLGQRVRCPVCQTIFEAASANGQLAAPEPTAPDPGPGTEQPLWKNLSLELDKSDPGLSKPAPPAPPPPPRAAPPPRKGLVGAVEVQTSMDDESGQQPLPHAGGSAPPAAPQARRQESPPPRRPPPSGPRGRDYADDDEDRPIRRGGYGGGIPRRDSEPHRGVLILVLGIISLVSVFLSLCYGIGILIGLPMGITSWVLGQGDLRKIKNREMDEEGLGMTQAGWICGILGVILHSLILLTCGGIITFALVMDASRSSAPKSSFGGTPPTPPVLKDK